MPVIVASSDKVFYLDEEVYNYRIHMNTTVKDFIKKIPNILDIVKCVEIVENELKKRNMDQFYKKQIESLYTLHTLFRIENAMFWLNLSKEDKRIVISSLINILDIKCPNWEEDKIVKYYRTKNKLFDFDMNRLNKFINSEYRFNKEEQAKDNIQKVFKK